MKNLKLGVQVTALVLLILILGNSCAPIPSSYDTTGDSLLVGGKVYQPKNLVYESNIKTVTLYSIHNNKYDYKSGSVAFKPIQNLVLEFDELGEEISDFKAKILHCNFDWTTSMLNDIEFVNEVNDFPIDNTNLAFNTKVPYVHYTFKLPRLKISGNYIIKVFRDNDENDLVLTRRFIIYDNKIFIDPKVRPSYAVAERDKNQQIEFNINYGAYPNISNPKEEVKVVLRQNKAWQNAITNLKPLYVRESRKVLEYNYFKLENNFKALNEYRNFDASSIRFLGNNIARINIKKKNTELWLALDYIKANRAYIKRKDENGRFLVNKYESNQNQVEADYINVYFSLASPTQLSKDVYVIGGFSDWQIKNEYKLSYNQKTKTYQAKLFFKQGAYDYLYATYDKNTKQVSVADIEGTYQETENDYDIIVYYRPAGQRADLVLGYISFNSLTKF